MKTYDRLMLFGPTRTYYTGGEKCADSLLIKLVDVCCMRPVVFPKLIKRPNPV